MAATETADDQQIIVKRALSLRDDAAAFLGVDPDKLCNLLRNVWRTSDGKPPLTNEEMFQGIALVARYQLDPLARDIYVTRSSKGLIVIVGIDGWIKILNRCDHYDGFEQELTWTESGELDYCDTTIYSKDRRPTKYRAYWKEYKRVGGFVKDSMPSHMLRVFSLRHAARLFTPIGGNVMSEEEGKAILEAEVVPGSARRLPESADGPVTLEHLTEYSKRAPELQTAPEPHATEESTPEPSEPEIAKEPPLPATNGLIWQVGAGLQPPKLMQRKTKSITDPVRVHVAFNQAMAPQAIFADDAQGMAKEWLQKNIAQNGLLDFRWVERASLMNFRTESMAESATEEPEEPPQEDFEQDDRMQRYIDLIEATKGWGDLDKLQNQFLGDEQLDMDQKNGLMAAMADQRKAVKQAWM